MPEKLSPPTSPSSSLHEFGKAYFIGPLVFSLLFAVSVAVFASSFGGFFFSIWPTVLLATILIAALVGSISPLMSPGHRLDRNGLHLNMGLRFRKTIPWSDIISASRYEGRVVRRGVGFSLTDPVIYLVTAETGMVKIDIVPTRFPQALWKKADTVVLSFRRPERFLKEFERWKMRDRNRT